LVSPLAPGVIGERTGQERSPEVLLDGQELREVLAHTENTIELRNEYGRCYRVVSKREALALNLDLFIGIGNRRRLRFPALSNTDVHIEFGQSNNAAGEKRTWC
jgi:hypothetical protein